MADKIFTPLKKKEQKVANAISQELMSYFNQMNGTSEQIARKSQIDQSTIKQQILDNNENPIEFSYEDIIQMKAPTNYGFLYKGGKEARNDALGGTASCIIKVGEKEESDKVYTDNHNNLETEGPPKEENKDNKQIENKQNIDNENKSPIPTKKNNKHNRNVKNAIKSGIMLAKLYGGAIIYKDNEEYKASIGNGESEDKKYGLIQEDDGTMGFTLSNDATSKNIKMNYKKENTKISKENAVIFYSRPEKIGDIVGNMQELMAKIYHEFVIGNNMTNVISKTLMKVKDEKEANDEAKRGINPFKMFLKQKVDPQTHEPANKITTEVLGLTIAEQLMKQIQAKKWFDETYNNFVGEPSMNAHSSKISGEFVAGQSSAIYKALAFYDRVDDAIEEFNEVFGESVNVDKQQQPTQVFGDLDNAGEENKTEEGKEDNQNATSTGASLKIQGGKE